jgi:protein ImuA
MSPRAVPLAALRDRIRQIEQPARRGALPFGVAAIDDALPGGGLARGAVHEILGAGGDEEDAAAPAAFAAAILARLHAGDGAGPILWCLKRPDLYGPGLQVHGLDPARLVLVRTPRDDELLWAVEEGLRAPGLAAVVGEIGRLPMVTARRLQLAAERSGVTAFLLRRWRNATEAAAERERPSAAVTRWRITSLPSDFLFSTFPRKRSRNPSPSMGEGLGGGDAAASPMPKWKWRLPNHPLPIPPPSWGRELSTPLAGEGVRGSGIGRPRWRVELLRVRGGLPAAWDVEVADATGHVSLSAELADRPAASQRKHAEPFVRRAG